MYKNSFFLTLAFIYLYIYLITLSFIHFIIFILYLFTMQKAQTKRQYSIVLVQSQRTIPINRKQQTEQNFHKFTKQNMRLKNSSSFWSLDDDFQTIYENFNLLSYLSTDLRVRILARTYGNGKDYIEADLFTFFSKNQQKYLMIQTEKNDFKGQYPIKIQPLKIKYQVLILSPKFQQQQTGKTIQQKISSYILNCSKGESNQKSKILQASVYTDIQTIQKHQNGILKQQYVWCHIRNKKQAFENQRELIKIEIADKEGWIDQKFKMIDCYTHRISPIRKAKIGQTQYFYLEPQNQRNKIIQGDHLSLALQGGGCKGVQYVGAYKAKIACVPNLKISSIIGSSAGSILGLAICLSMRPQQIQNICIQKLSKVTDDQKYKIIDREGKNFLKQTYQNIIESLEKFNILQPQLLGIIEMCLDNQQIRQKILQLIKVATNPEVYKLFKEQTKDGNSKPKLNLLGLLKGTLMSGNIIKKIGISCIKSYLETRKDSEQFKRILKNHEKYQNLSQKDLMEIHQLNSLDQLAKLDKFDIISQRLTMKQLYDLTGVEFTCTTVDVNNQILRFLNQKTTPNLPVCKAVQMSGSFPVAFQSQSWKRHWGKYYIYYDGIRKQINLEGCHLTDGGTLANFPVQYLDNQDMRPMYFSHTKTDLTKIFGIGLLQDLPDQKQKKKQIDIIITQLGTIATNLIGKCKPLSSWLLYKINCKKPQQKQIDVNLQNKSNFLQIPLIKFLLDILNTYTFSKDNLIQECFSHTAYQTPVRSSYRNEIENRITFEEIKNSLKNLSKNIQELSKHNKQTPFQILNSNLQLLYNKSQFIPYEMGICLTIIKTNQIISNFMHHLIVKVKNSGKIIKYYQLMIECQMPFFIKTLIPKEELKSTSQQKMYQILKNCLMKILQKFYQILRSKAFKLCSIQQDYKQLKQIINFLLQFYKKLNSQTAVFGECLEQIRKKQILSIQQIANKILKYANQITQQNNLQNRKILYNLYKIKQQCITFSSKALQQIYKDIRNCKIPYIFTNQQAQRHRLFIENYVFKRINNFYSKQNINSSNVAPDGLHMVFQSVALSQLYFHQYYLSVKDALHHYNKQNNKQNNQLKITSMTATGYQSIIIFLHSSDLSQQRIGSEILRIRDFVKVNIDEINHKYKKADWAKITPIMLRQLQKLAIEKKKDIFKYIEQDILKNQDKYNKQFTKIKQQIQQQIHQVRLSNEDIVNSIETSLSYIVKVLSEVENKQYNDNQKISKILQDKLFLKWNERDNSQQIGNNFSNRIQSIFSFFYSKYENIIKYLIVSSPFVVNQVMNLLRPKEREQAWKGLILSQFIEINNIKSYVQGILTELKLNKNSTLKQFYKNSSKKIQINFPVVQGDCVNILNYKTRPNMPVWAAVLAASSIPQFFPPLLDHPQWRQKEQQSYDKRHVLSYFQKKQPPYKFLTSAETITRLPLDLLQNNQFRKKITDYQKQIFIVFNFMECKFKHIFKSSTQTFRISSFTLGQAISKFVSFKSMIFPRSQQVKEKQRKYYDQQKNAKALGMLAHLPFIQTKANILDLYISSHDNLITKLYQKQLVQMPIRFSTLDFHLMTKKQNETQKLSDICQDAIMQAQYILTQKIKNNPKVPKQKQNPQNQLKNQKLIQKYVQNSKRRIYFRIQSCFQQKSLNQQKYQEIQQDRMVGNKLKKTQQNKMRKQKMQKSQNMKIKRNNVNSVNPSSQSLYQNLIISKNLNKNQNYDSNVLKIRFLSMLNPSRSLYQKYYVYYQKQIVSSDIQQIQKNKQNNINYIRLQKQSINISQSKYIRRGSLKIKIQYPSLDETQIKTSQYEIKLDKLFAENKKQNNFGSVYYIEYDQIYPQKQLKPVNWMQNMAQKQQDLNVKCYNINIKSNITNSFFNAILCQVCLKQLIKVKDPQTNKLCYKCKDQSCGKKYSITKNYNLSYNYKKGCIECLFGHNLNRMSPLDVAKDKDQKNIFKLCTICEVVCLNNYWNDQLCGIVLCNPCRILCQKN